MKQTLRLLCCIIIAAACSLSVSAQSHEGKRDHKANPEEFAKVQANHIADELKLDEATSSQFVKIYCDCSKEIWALGKPGRGRKPATDAEAEQAINRRFDHGQKMLDIRKKYYNEYRKILTPLQIEHVYQLEEQMMRNIQDRRPGNGRRAKPEHQQR